MVKSLVSGLVLAVCGALVIGLSGLLELDLEHVALLGAALGGVLGLVPSRPMWGKVAGFAVGFVAAWLGFALRAAWLPDSAGGRAVAAFLVVAVVAVVSAATSGRLPLWSGLLGAAAIVGAYEEVYTNAPSQFLAESPVAGTTVLLAVALGLLVTTLVTGTEGLAADAADTRRPRHSRPDAADTTADQPAGLSGLDDLAEATR